MEKTLSIKFNQEQVWILDQTQLPHVTEWVEVSEPENCVKAIQALKVRGAPLIGITAALTLGIYALKTSDKSRWEHWGLELKNSRPTAVNLIHHLTEMLTMISQDCRAKELYQKAVSFYKQDQDMCMSMATYGYQEFKNFKNILTHCNTGSLATAGVGTALGVIKELIKNKPDTHVYVDETRPLLQGGRLTAWELQEVGAHYQIITDNMAGFLMQQKKVDAVIVGADRIAANGDTANKIGTYSLAVLCHHHKIPFYIAAPMTTVDPQVSTGEDIPIELRSPEEVKGFMNSLNPVVWAPENALAYNPAFDWVPAELITAWITDQGVFKHVDIKKGCFAKEVL